MRAFPLIRDLVTDVSWNYRVKQTIKPFKPRKPDAADGTWRMQQREVDRVQEFRKCIECFLCQDVCHILRDHQLHDELHRSAVPALQRRARDAPARHRGSPRRLKDRRRHRLLQHHPLLHQGVPGAHHHHRERDHPAQGTGGRSVLRSGDAAVADDNGVALSRQLSAIRKSPVISGDRWGSRWFC